MMPDAARTTHLSDRRCAFYGRGVSIAAELADVVDRIAHSDADLHAFVDEPGRADRVRAEVDAMTRRWPDPEHRPPLHGVPLGVKDVFRVDGLPTRAGSAVPAELLDGAEATAVTRLRAAGAVVAGKTVTTEFAYFAPGPTRNPHHPEHTPGGSSSGSAAAVAAGLVPLALGTQTVGSVIRPAAYCGCIGFKPTYGRVPCDGVIANAPTFDTVGLFAADPPLAMAATAALVHGWGPVAPGERPVLGVPAGPYLDQADVGACGAFATQITALRAAGYDVREVAAVDDIAQVNRRQIVVNLVELARGHEAWFDRYADRYRPQTAAAIREGRSIDVATYRAALDGVHALRRTLPQLMADAGIDVWICPSATGPAPRGLDTTGSPAMSVPWTQAGLPALSLPASTVVRDPGGPALPVGLQCVGRPGADERLLAWAPDIAEAVR
ncbi:Asp-tRNA(Asn)/Glu-tRNA(Gln) amidotransferase A subunit family amidase [Pseudonocardia hierapolitana]|uniref:Asp-tRNA(Asn)/Glu-tRNA(Gln) amidotransferase A subunit family amidase n=1 Tax=Pseudonocardia hierapolitana TaxID=1128676 RepID=A0A561SSG5_9PSEU|nr:Asp-tRNA(Asn)/Glu-tRNA(Gln) amidotransferase A subunit family amidase [Pseudonocardia hierapolitana]